MRRALALLAVPVAVMLTGCVGEPEPEPTPITREQACAALGLAVAEFHERISPGSEVEVLEPRELPDFNGVRIPQPSCAFKVSPDPAVVPGDVFTLENFYLDYAEDLTVSIPGVLESAGFKRNGDIHSWLLSNLGRTYSAAMLVFSPGDGQPYSEAAEHFRVLALTLSKI